MNERKNAYPTVGFIGAGAITQAVVTGFCERAADTPFPIVLSPRSRETAARLRAAYPARVSVATVRNGSCWLCRLRWARRYAEACGSVQTTR